MVMGFTSDFVCPECASMQKAAVLELTPGGQGVKSLRCVVCKTVWHPCDDQAEHAGGVTEVTPDDVDGE